MSDGRERTGRLLARSLGWVTTLIVARSLAHALSVQPTRWLYGAILGMSLLAWAVVSFRVARVTAVALGGGLLAAALWKRPQWLVASWKLVLDCGNFLGAWLAQADPQLTVPVGYALLIAASGLLGAVNITLADRGRPAAVLLVGAVILSVEWLLYVDRALFYLSALLVPCALLQAVTLHRRRGLRLATVGMGNIDLSWQHLVWVLALALCIAAVAHLLPHRIAPWRWDALNEWITDVFPVLERLRGGGVGGPGMFGYRLRHSGYGTGTKLGGPISPRPGVALRVEVRGSWLPEVLYLRGTVSSTYTGSQWLTTAGGTETVQPGELLPSRIPSHVPVAYISQRVTFRELETVSLFCAGEPATFRIAGATLLRDREGNIFLRRLPAAGFSYRVLSRWPLPDERALRQGPAAEPPPDLAAQLSLPDTVTARTRRLAQAICASHPTPWEKAVALEQYLRALPYETQVPAPEPGRDFVDHFLFTLRRGYCAHHSSALAVMLRLVGIPSRWVQGFAVPIPPQVREAGGGVLEVHHHHAHAWVEAWMPNFGWVLLEPTPTQPIPWRHAGRAAVPSSGREPAEETALPGAWREELELFHEPELTMPPTPSASPLRWPQIAAAIAVAVVGLKVGVSVAASWWRWRHLAAGPGDLFWAWRQLERLCGQFGLGRRPAETLRQFAARLEDHLAEPSRLQGLVRELEEVAYGGGQPPARLLREVRWLYASVAVALRRRHGWPRYLWRRWLTI